MIERGDGFRLGKSKVDEGIFSDSSLSLTCEFK